ncbi:MAG: hypothetical protein HY656_03485 [Acidobacteria bacterium]|nr:hypothetical protein [Acidobacteriota bacterium]
MLHCDRCGKPTPVTHSSPLNRDQLCEACLEEERKNFCFNDADGDEGELSERDETVVGAAGPGKDGINFYR